MLLFLKLDAIFFKNEFHYLSPFSYFHTYYFLDSYRFFHITLRMEYITTEISLDPLLSPEFRGPVITYTKIPAPQEEAGI